MPETQPADREETETMSYERRESFVEGADASAATIESEFDNIADAFNGLFRAGRASASDDLSLKSAEYNDIPGASVTLTLSAPGLLMVNALFELELPAGGLVFEGALNVDGSNQAQIARLSYGEHVAFQSHQTWCVPLGVGVRTIKLRGRNELGEAGKVKKTNSGFTYLLIPEP
jgi:hypothetical protein